MGNQLQAPKIGVAAAPSVRGQAAAWAWGDSEAAHAGQRWLPEPADQVEREARATIARGRAVGVVPRYGNPDWSALTWANPGKLPGLIVAAESWRQDGSAAAIAARWHFELEHGRRLELQEADRLHAEIAPRVRAMAFVLLAMSREAEIAAANEPRPGDYHGGPVPWLPTGGSA